MLGPRICQHPDLGPPCLWHCSIHPGWGKFCYSSQADEDPGVFAGRLPFPASDIRASSCKNASVVSGSMLPPSASASISIRDTTARAGHLLLALVQQHLLWLTRSFLPVELRRCAGWVVQTPYRRDVEDSGQDESVRAPSLTWTSGTIMPTSWDWCGVSNTASLSGTS